MLADRIGLTPQHISQVELAETYPSEDFVAVVEGNPRPQHVVAQLGSHVATIAVSSGDATAARR